MTLQLIAELLRACTVHIFIDRDLLVLSLLQVLIPYRLYLADDPSRFDIIRVEHLFHNWLRLETESDPLLLHLLMLRLDPLRRREVSVVEL